MMLIAWFGVENDASSCGFWVECCLGLLLVVLVAFGESSKTICFASELVARVTSKAEIRSSRFATRAIFFLIIT